MSPSRPWPGPARVNGAEISWAMIPDAPDDAPLTLEDFLAHPARPEQEDPFALPARLVWCAPSRWRSGAELGRRLEDWTCAPRPLTDEELSKFIEGDMERYAKSGSNQAKAGRPSTDCL